MTAFGAFVVHAIDELELVVTTSRTISGSEVACFLVDLLHPSESPQLLLEELGEIDPAVGFPPLVDVLTQGDVHFRHAIRPKEY